MKFITSQSGNVLFLLLLGITLFAALGFTVAQMIGSETPQAINEEQASLQAGEILDQARNVRQTVQNLKISNRCDEADISFQNSVLSGYAHAPAAPTKCKVFESTRGGMASYPRVPEIWLDTDYSSATRYGEMVFSGELCVAGLPDGAWNGCDSDGLDNEELVMIVPFIRKELCLKINDALGIDNPAGDAPIDTGCSWGNVFDGTYADAESIGAASGELESRMQGCYRHDASCGTHSGSYHFYQVLIQR